jgi:hypothetical protein
MTARVNLMILGAMKCGTTTLAQILGAHPDICVSDPKEPNYFSHVVDTESQITKYHQNFCNFNAKYRCDASPAYTCFPKYGAVWQRIHAYNAEMKLLYLMRHPIDRIVSNYVHAFERGFTRSSIGQAVREDPYYLHRTRYFTQINPYIEQFGRQQIHLIFFDDLVNRREAVIGEALDFLDVDKVRPENQSEHVHANQSLGVKRRHKSLDAVAFNPMARALARWAPGFLWRPVWKAARKVSSRKIPSPQVDSDTRHWILDELRDDMHRLEALCNRDLGDWLE